ncbi:MAG: glycosyltransferase family 4 protein [Candidatus Acidiferrales bacterium]
MRILFVATNLPIPPNNGQAIRSLSIVQALASSGHEVNFVSFVGKGRAETLDPLSSYCREIDMQERELTNVTQGADYLRRLGCLLSFRPYSVERFRSAPMRARIQEHLQAGHFDIIVCDGLYALVNVPDTEVPIALNCHNVEYVILERYSQVEKNVFKKYYARMEAQLMRRVERSSCDRAAIAMVCSSDDRETLGQLNPRLPIFIVPNAVDTDSYSPNGSHRVAQPDPVLLFQGGMDWYPNRDAVEFFAHSIFHLIREAFPTAKFVIAGRNPPANFVEQLSALGGVEFTGTVPDMRPYLAAATVVVVPLRMGSGTRLKILEACAAGKPIVSTSIGAEGLSLEPGKDIFLADDPDDFARSVVMLLRDPARREAIARSARAIVVERYSHPALKKSLDIAVSSLTATREQGTANKVSQ